MGKLMRLVVLSVAFVCFGSFATATAEWFNYSSPVAASDFAFTGGHVWIPALGGVVDLNPQTGDFTVYTSSTGLPCSCGNGAAVDQEGVVWVAMTKGVAAIHPDGTIDRFYAENSALESDYARAIAVGEDGLVWVGTDEGVYSYDGSVWAKHPFMGIPYLIINNVIKVGSGGTVWIGTEGGLRVFDGTNWTDYTEMSSGLPSGGGGNVRDIDFAPDGRTWLATYGGVVSFDGVVWEVFDSSNTPMTTNIVEAIAAAPDGTIYAGCPNGVFVYDGSEWVVWDTSNSGIPTNNITALDIAPDEALWVGTFAGSAAFKDDVWTGYSHTNYPELKGLVQRLAEDADGVIWLGTMGGGLFAKDGDSFTVYSVANSGLLSDMVSAISIATDNTLWLATPGGVSHFDRTDFENYSFSLGNFPASGSVVDICVGPDGTPWAVVGGGLMGPLGRTSQTPGQVCYFINGEWQTLQMMALAEFSCITARENGDIYIGSNGQGLFIWNHGSVKHIDTSQGLPSNTVLCLARGADDNVWVGTDSGVGITDGVLWQVYGIHNTMLFSNEIRDIFPAEDGAVWIASSNGLVSINTNTSVRYSSQYSGLLIDNTSSVLKASNGDIVVGSMVGLTELTTPSFPILTDGSVGPDTGTPTTPFTYSVHYTNAEASLPPAISVGIDLSEYELQLADGEPDNGTYSFSTVLDFGLHGYYFLATDENGARTRMPFDFILSGPIVTGKPAEVIIRPDKVIYVPGDRMQVLLTLFNRVTDPLEITLYTALKMPSEQLIFFVYPDLFTMNTTGLTLILSPLQLIQDFPILDIVLDEATLPYGEYAWLAACQDPNAPGFELLSDVSEATWQFMESQPVSTNRNTSE
ncbi:MAG TPA: two-component regulator propeller domain-containing protein [bacterium]|nr:two-component regulator propeller domain-containing protein [bacterium]